jgi:hypothetical protein
MQALEQLVRASLYLQSSGFVGSGGAAMPPLPPSCHTKDAGVHDASASLLHLLSGSF